MVVVRVVVGGGGLPPPSYKKSPTIYNGRLVQIPHEIKVIIRGSPGIFCHFKCSNFFFHEIGHSLTAQPPSSVRLKSLIPEQHKSYFRQSIYLLSPGPRWPQLPSDQYVLLFICQQHLIKISASIICLSKSCIALTAQIE